MSGYRIVEYKAHDEELKPYLNHIQASWKRSLKEDNDWFKLIDKQAFYDAYNGLIQNILERPDITVYLALLHEDPDVVLGWSVYEGDVLHYVYVKGSHNEVDARRQGIGRQLVHAPFNVFTHLTFTGLTIWQTHFRKAKFNPFR